MSLTVATAAFIVESLIFHMLQEPEMFARMGYIVKYLTELFKGWTAAMSAASLIFLFLPLFFPNFPVSARYIWTLSALCLFAAGYQVWRREHRLVEAKDAEIGEVSRGKNLPLIKGNAFDFTFNGIIGTGHAEGRWHISSAVLFKVNLCNHNERETNLQGLKLDGSALEPPIEFGPVNMYVDEQEEHPSLLSGKGVTLRSLQAAATVYGFEHKEDVPRIPLDKLKVIAVDGFTKEHIIDVKNGEQLKFVSW
jgi:hypothetical protein